MKLIDEAGKAWKMFSVQAQVIALTALGVWQTLPPELIAAAPPWLPATFLAIALVLGTVGRLVKQESVSGPSK